MSVGSDDLSEGFELVIHESRDHVVQFQQDEIFENLKKLLETKDDEELLLGILQLSVDTGSFRRLIKSQVTELLRIAVTKGFADATQFLLDYGADVSNSMAKNVPLNEHGFRSTFSNLFQRKLMQSVDETDFARPVDEFNDPLFIVALREFGTKSSTDRNHLKCCKILLAQQHVDVNLTDRWGFTGLHYAVKYKIDDLIKIFLEKNSFLGIIHKDDDKMLIESIEPKILHEHFDSCVHNNDFDCNGSIFYEINLNYRNFIQPRNAIGKERLATQIEIINFLARSDKHKNLILHPLIRYFIWIKWREIEFLFTWNSFLIINLLMAIVFLSIFNNDHYYRTNYWLHRGFDISTKVTMVIIGFREIFKYILAGDYLRLRYFRSISHLIELTIVVLLSIVLFADENLVDDEIRRTLTSILILMIASEIMIIMESFPIESICIYAKILKSVSMNFIKLFTLYSIVIFSFSLSFYTLFSHRPFDGPTNDTERSLNFSTPWNAFFKTMVMVTGEYDANTIDFSYNFMKHFVFLGFVFFVSIILVNLMNGLAVSDTQEIKSEAKINVTTQHVRQIIKYNTHIYRNPTMRKFVGMFMKWTRYFHWTGLYRMLTNYVRQFHKISMILVVPEKGTTKIERLERGDAKGEYTTIMRVEHNLVEEFNKIFKARKDAIVHSQMASEDEEWKKNVEDKLNSICKMMMIEKDIFVNENN